jgi:hypothetical protein
MRKSVLFQYKFIFKYFIDFMNFTNPVKPEIFDFIVLRGCTNYYKIVDFDNSALYYFPLPPL